MIPRPPCKTLSLVTALFLAGATAHAQQQGAGMGMQQQTPQTTQQPVPGQALAPANALAPDTPSPEPATPSYADQIFVKDAFDDNQAQIDISQLAQQKSPSDDVKQFSQQMVKIHTQLDTQLEPIAKQLDVSTPKKPSKKEKKEIARLESLSGPDFDTAYLQDMAKAQQHSLKEFRNEESAKNPLMQKVAKLDEPVLSQHFEILEKLAQVHNVALESSK